MDSLTVLDIRSLTWASLGYTQVVRRGAFLLQALGADRLCLPFPSPGDPASSCTLQAPAAGSVSGPFPSCSLCLEGSSLRDPHLSLFTSCKSLLRSLTERYHRPCRSADAGLSPLGKEQALRKEIMRPDSSTGPSRPRVVPPHSRFLPFAPATAQLVRSELRSKASPTRGSVAPMPQGQSDREVGGLPREEGRLRGGSVRHISTPSPRGRATSTCLNTSGLRVVR